MAFTSRVFQLPVELMSIVIDWLPIEGIVLLSAVSAKWRTVAHSHPLFWRDIRLAALSSTALSLFHARLDHAKGRGINLTIRLHNNPSCWRIKSIVLPAIARHLPQFVNLDLVFRADVHASVFVALKHPAPRLQRLALRFYYCLVADPAVLLVPDLFACSSPKLVSVTLSNVKLPAKRVLAFDAVNSLVLDFEYQRPFALSTFRHFPALKMLAVVGDSCVGVEDVPARKPETPRLSSLEISVCVVDYDSILNNIPHLDTIPNIACQTPHPEVMNVLLGHLDGPIEMEFCCHPIDTVDITLRAPRCGRTRTFVEHAENLPEDWAPGPLFERAFAERVTTLRVSAQLAYLAPRFPELPACRTLEVFLDDDPQLPCSFGGDMAPLKLPNLANLKLDAAGSCAGKLSADQLTAFLAELVGHPANRPALRLEYVSLTGDSKSLASVFDMQ